MRTIVWIWGALSLAGCAGSPAESALMPEKVAAREDAYCRSLGAQLGTPRYQDCRIQLAGMRSDRHGRQMAAAIGSMQPVVVQPIQPIPPMTTYRPPVNCTTVALGPNMASTNCQ